MPVDIDKLIQQVQPLPGEDQPSFAMRFHSGLSRAIPKTSERNAAMLKAWGTDPLAATAMQHWPADKYFRLAASEHPEASVFSEHHAVNSDGTQSYYGPDQLAAIVRNLNRRIEDTGNYSVLIDGHTPEKPTDPQPDVVGHAGPFYLGQIGNLNPRWAIFADEHHRKDEKARLETHPNRSPEIWRAPRVEDRILDPIAVLGAETPRLDGGMVRYSVRSFAPAHDGVERFDMSCMAGPNNVYVPSFSANGKKKTDKYAEEEDSDMAGLDEAALARICSEVTNAVAEMPENKAMRALISSGAIDKLLGPGWDSDGGADPEGDSPEPEAAQPTDAFDDDDDDDVDPANDDAADSDSAPEAKTEASPAVPTSPEPKAETPESAAPAEAPAADAGNDMAAKVKALEAEVAALKAQLGQKNSEHYRRDTLTALERKGVQLDVDTELAMTCDFSPEQFERYASNIAKERLRIPLADVIGKIPVQPAKEPDPVAEMGADHPDVEKYSRMAGEQALKSGKAYMDVFLEIAPDRVKKAIGIG